VNFVKKGSINCLAEASLKGKFSGSKNLSSPLAVIDVPIGRAIVKMSTTIFKFQTSDFRLYLQAAVLACAIIGFAGCKEPQMSGSEQVKAFELAGPIIPQLDIDQILKVKDNRGIYTVGTGDVLELQIPTILTAVSPKLYKDQQQQVQLYLCRISDSGTIALPIIGEMNVQGKTLAQIENEIVIAYYPKYTVALPSIVCNVKEYYLKDVTIVGAVAQPGMYKLRSNEMSLVNALMKAGGIVEGGASIITIKNPSRKYATGQQSSSTGSAQAAKPANEVRQLAEFDTGVSKSDSSALAVDLVFRPEASSPTQGTLLVQRDSETLYSKRINIKNPAARAEYTKELRNVIGTEQAYIVGQAIEQLAGQLAPAITTSQTKQTGGEEKTELLDAADESKHNSTYIPKPIKSVSSDYRPAGGAIEDIVLPVKGLNIPFADIPLMEGDLVEVKRLNPAVFTVIGLAKNPGAFPYPPDVEYNLMQGLGFAGGVDLIADPRFVSIYRQDSRGEVVSAVFRIDNKFMAKSYNVKIKPGDVISIDVTPRTKRNVLLHQILRLNFGIFINPLATND
jgi:protein involved in polysaccharide export with SLBB domain